jgi:SAM-dependent methyltransferase
MTEPGSLSTLVVAHVKLRLRPLARRVGLAAAPTTWWQSAGAPWRRRPPAGEGAWCNVCDWSGDRFEGTAHVESAVCPRCGSIARDRFLFWCAMRRTPHPALQRVLETSPRMGPEYRQSMRAWFRYQASDFDERQHVADVRIDLQDIDLPDDSLDLVLTPHVLEHVPDTDRALAELRRVVAPGGRVYLQVPLLQAVTAPPVEPEFHDDDTPVFWRFGWDLTDRIRSHGFEVDVLVPETFRRLLSDPAQRLDDSGEFLLSSIVPHPRPSDLVAVADDVLARRLGFEPAFQHVVWECRTVR